MKRRFAQVTVIVLLCICAGRAIADEPASLDLQAYKLSIGPIRIEDIEDNASGLTYSPVTRTLFMVLNDPTVMIELDRTGKVQRRIGLKWFEDTEGIAWIRNNTFGILEEGRGNIVFATLSAVTNTIDRLNCRASRIDSGKLENKGLEGLSCDRRSPLFYAVKEKRPRRIYSVRLSPDAPPPRPTCDTPWDIQAHSLGLGDLSGIHYDPATGHLLLLSDDSRCVVECTVRGKQISRMLLSAGNSGLSDDIPQPEGIVLDDRGMLWICSEPNLLYGFSRSRSPSARPRPATHPKP